MGFQELLVYLEVHLARASYSYSSEGALPFRVKEHLVSHSEESYRGVLGITMCTKKLCQYSLNDCCTFGKGPITINGIEG